MGDAYTLPPDLRSFVHTMLPGMDIDKIHVTGWYNEQRTGRVHMAYDIQGKAGKPGRGTNVCSPINGRIVQVDLEYGMVWIVDNDGNYVRLGHMTGIDGWYEQVEQGTAPVVQKGQVIGQLSNVGVKDANGNQGPDNKGNHLDFQVGTGYLQGDNFVFNPENPYGAWLDRWAATYGVTVRTRDNPLGPGSWRYCYIGKAYPPFSEAGRAGDPLRRDPLVIDLDGDGIKTSYVRDFTTYFDNNADGFAELTAWVDPHDGLLAMDRNGNGIIDNGKELFGDQTGLAEQCKGYKRVSGIG